MKILVALLFLPVLLGAQTVDQGKEELKKGRIAEAKKVFESVLQSDEKNAEAHYLLASVFMRRDFRNEDEASDHAERAAELSPENAEYQYMYGAALGSKAQRAGVFKQAFMAPKIKNAFLKATELNPNHVQARIGLAQYYLRAPSIMGGDTEKGWENIEAAIKLDEFTGRMTKYRILEQDKKFVEAEQELKLLTAKMPKEWRVWKATGYFYYGQKRNDEAVGAMNKYVDLRPDTADSFKSLAEVQLQKGDHSSAFTNLKKALALDNNFITAVYLLGRTHEAIGRKKEARESYQRVLELNPSENMRKLVEKNLKELS